jgi:multidrug resistance protein, MATE family
MVRLAAPVIVAELGWMSMGVVDTLMVSPLGPSALGAVGIGNMLFMAAGIFGIGLLLGLDTVVSQAHGASDRPEADRWLISGLWLAVVVAVPLGGALWLMFLGLDRIGLHPDVEPLVRAYLPTASVSIAPLLVYVALRRYLQGLSRVGPITFALISANVVNIATNWVLIHGRLGMPALGVQGAAWATLLSRLYMALVLAVVVWLAWRGGAAAHRWGPDTTRLRRLFLLGLPAALQLLFEVGIFTAATALAGRLEPASLAAHHIALNIISVIFMVPLGISSAGAVLVGQGLGARDGAGAAGAGWAAVMLVLVAMTGAAVAFWWRPALWIGLFTTDAGVIAIGSQLLLVAAAFQLFDGLQVVSTGVLRGLGETRVPMLVGLVGYWGVGLPLGYWLCFVTGHGVIGLWLGLCAGLMLVGTALLWLWYQRIDATLATLGGSAVA